MPTYDYTAIESALQTAYDLLKDELDILINVEANPELILQYERDMSLINEAAEIVFRYEELEH